MDLFTADSELAEYAVSKYIQDSNYVAVEGLSPKIIKVFGNKFNLYYTYINLIIYIIQKNMYRLVC